MSVQPARAARIAAMKNFFTAIVFLAALFCWASAFGGYYLYVRAGSTNPAILYGSGFWAVLGLILTVVAIRRDRRA